MHSRLWSIAVILFFFQCMLRVHTVFGQNSNDITEWLDNEDPSWLILNPTLPSEQNPPAAKRPTRKPTRKPTPKPTPRPTTKPTRKPTPKPTPKPTRKPTSKPTNQQSAAPVDEITETYDAVIIGAGWAGLRAARVLLNNGIQDIIVLEANDYIGGRSKTQNADGSINDPKRETSNKPIELGSEWLYMDTKKEDYLQAFNLIDGAYPDYSGAAYFINLEVAQFYIQTELSDDNIQTKLLSNSELNDLERRVWGGFLNFRDSILDRYSDVSYFAAAEAYKNNYLSSDRDKQFLNLVLDAGEIDYVGEMDELSLKSYDWFTGGMCETYYMSVPGVGFGNVAADFASSFRGKIRLNSKVTGVNYQDSRNTVVSYTQNGGATKYISAKKVLVTASLGVLKAGNINFTPSLPTWKQDVIDEMGFGLLNKCAMQWTKWGDVVWPDRYWFELITPDDASSGRWTSFFNPTTLKNVPTLIGWAAGKEARDIENQSDEEILDEVMDRLKAMFPTIERPDRVVITRWSKEENVLGTYSFNRVGRSFNRDSESLQRNVAERLFFAGEATAGRSWSGTTTGAWMTGEDAAWEIIQSLNR